MENIALIDSFSDFKDDKSIDRVTLMSILEEVFRAALKRKFGSTITSILSSTLIKEIWKFGEIESLLQTECLKMIMKKLNCLRLRKIEPDFEIGEDVSEEVKLIDLGRRAILALRQNLISKIHEHDSTNIFKQFKELEGEIYSRRSSPYSS